MISTLIYRLALWLGFPFILLYLLKRARQQPQYLEHWGERFGFYPGEPDGVPLIWLHAVSVGEIRGAVQLINLLAKAYPTYRLLLTCMTPTGRMTALDILDARVSVFFLPYDYPGAIQRFLKRFNPCLGILMETELWPNLIHLCAKQKIPVILANARLSEKSLKGYLKILPLIRPAVAQLSGVFAQNESDAQRLRQLGVPHPTVMGNMKFDQEPSQIRIAQGYRWRSLLGSRPVLLVASSREGEEVQLLDALFHTSIPIRFQDALASAPLIRGAPCADRHWSYIQMPIGHGANTESGEQRSQADHAIQIVKEDGCKRPPEVLVVIVPRHPQRFDEVADLMATRGLRYLRRSLWSETPVPTDIQVMLGDSIGEMTAWYVAADVAIMGGSILPFGSQNLIEPCAVGTPVLLGSSTFNFAEVAQTALTAGAACQSNEVREIAITAIELLADLQKRVAMGKAGLSFSAQYRGASQRLLDEIKKVLE